MSRVRTKYAMPGDPLGIIYWTYVENPMPTDVTAAVREYANQAVRVLKRTWHAKTHVAYIIKKVSNEDALIMNLAVNDKYEFQYFENIGKLVLWKIEFPTAYDYNTLVNMTARAARLVTSGLPGLGFVNAAITLLRNFGIHGRVRIRHIRNPEHEEYTATYTII